MKGLRERDAYFCNLKVLLLFLVILGHWLEPFLDGVPLAAEAYRVAYTVHMPLFAFLSGTFLTSARQARSQAGKSLLYYLPLQGAVCLACAVMGQPASLLTPFWHLWYLLSLCQWSLLCLFLERVVRLFDRPRWIQAGALLLAAGIGCGVGCLPWVGRTLSLSRTLVFLPYVLAGRMCPKGWFRGRWRLGAAAFALFSVLFVQFGGAVPTDFLYQADSPALPLGQAAVLRLLCYAWGALLGTALLAFTPGRRFPVSRMGTDTLGIYLCHAPLVGILRQFPAGGQAMVLAGPAVSFWILWLLYRAFRWRGQMCAVRVSLRRGGETP